MADEIAQQLADLAALCENPDREWARAKLRLAAAPGADEPKLPPIAPLREYLERELPVPPVLVEPRLVVRGGVGVTIAHAGKGKTVMSMNRIIRWAAGKPWFDDLDALSPTRPLRTLVVENEGAPGLFHEVLKTMVEHAPLDSDDAKQALDNVLIWGEGGHSNLKLDKLSDYELLSRGCEIHEPDIIFAEPMRQLWRGNENDATEMANLVDALVQVGAEHNAATMITHHRRKSPSEDGEQMDEARGSTVLSGIVASFEHFRGVPGRDQKELSWSKLRYGQPPAPIRLEWDPAAWWYRHVPEHELDHLILEHLAQSGSAWLVGDLCEELGERRETVQRRLSKLVENERIKRSLTPTSTGGKKYAYRIPSVDGDENGAMDL